MWWWASRMERSGKKWSVRIHSYNHHICTIYIQKITLWINIGFFFYIRCVRERISCDVSPHRVNGYAITVKWKRKKRDVWNQLKHSWGLIWVVCVSPTNEREKCTRPPNWIANLMESINNNNNNNNLAECLFTISHQIKAIHPRISLIFDFSLCQRNLHLPIRIDESIDERARTHSYVTSNLFNRFGRLHEKNIHLQHAN